MRTHSRITIAHHLILTGYSHWPPNDPRGSGSKEIRKDELEQFGEIHPGRKPEHLQPSRAELRSFHRSLKPMLEHEPIWFDTAKRQAVADAFAEVVAQNRYTCWACAVCSNHAHLLIRRHRDDALTMWRNFAQRSAERLRLLADVPPDHRIWSERPYKVFLYTPADVRSRIEYIESNPAKEGLPPQRWPFVLPYDGWPHANKPAR